MCDQTKLSALLFEDGAKDIDQICLYFSIRTLNKLLFYNFENLPLSLSTLIVFFQFPLLPLFVVLQIEKYFHDLQEIEMVIHFLQSKPAGTIKLAFRLILLLSGQISDLL